MLVAWIWDDAMQNTDVVMMRSWSTLS
jgi:hypothetical protein